MSRSRCWSGVWCVAIVGIVLKLVLPGRFDRLAILLYLAMGWSGVTLYDAVAKALPPLSLGFVVAGGILYTLGVIFHAWQRFALPERDLALFCLAGRGLPLYGSPRSRSELKQPEYRERELPCRWRGKSWSLPAAATASARRYARRFTPPARPRWWRSISITRRPRRSRPQPAARPSAQTSGRRGTSCT